MLIYCEEGNATQLFIWRFCVSLLACVHACACWSRSPTPAATESGQPAVTEAHGLVLKSIKCWIQCRSESWVVMVSELWETRWGNPAESDTRMRVLLQKKGCTVTAVSAFLATLQVSEHKKKSHPQMLFSLLHFIRVFLTLKSDVPPYWTVLNCRCTKPEQLETSQPLFFNIAMLFFHRLALCVWRFTVQPLGSPRAV